MTDEIKPTGETPAAPAKGTDAPVEPLVPSPAPPASEQEEVFDKERAMATIQKLRDIERKAKQDAKELERLKAEEQKRLDAQLSEAERAKKQLDELTARNARLESDILRRDVVAETGLPAIFAERLKGATKEEMLADAKELLKALPPDKPKPPHLNTTNPNAPASGETDQQKRDRLFGKQGNPFDFEAIKAKGGGVVFNK